MKKIILIVGMVLCVAIIGSVFAVTLYNAPKVDGTVGADSSLKLTIGGSADTNLDLVKGQAKIYTLELSYEASAAAVNTPTELVITKSNGSETSNLDKVSFTLCSDVLGTTAIEGENLDITGNVITLSGITSSTTVYLKVLLADDATAEEVQNTSGSIVIDFDKA